MKNKKRLSSTLMIALMFSAFQNVSAQYPTSNLVVGFNEQMSVQGTQSWSASPKENIFSVDGKKFILLDTDNEGNYFVLAEDHYGGYPIENGASTTTLIETAVTVEGVTTFTKSGKSVMDNENGLFNPNRNTNIAYWLNNDFVTQGNTSKYVFPKAVYDNIIERTWEIEGFNAYRGWKANDYYDKYFGITSASDYAKTVSRDSYTVNAKLALLSFTEYMEYKDKIGIEFINGAGWAGMLLRTSDVLVSGSISGDTRKLVAWQTPIMVRNASTDKTNKDKLIVSYADSFTTTEFFVRPCFWLNKDFFKTVACDMSYDVDGNINIGSYPLSMIKKHSYDDLKHLYSDAVLKKLGYDITEFELKGYPNHPQYVTQKETETLSRYGYCETDENYVFEVDGKKFILLDTDAKGNCFVLSEDLYGKKAFDTSYTKSKFTVESATEAADGTMTYAQGNIVDLDENQVLFNTTDTTNIGYWLNNDFLTSGNGTSGTLPEAIQEYLLEAEWEVEGTNGAILGWQAKDYYDTLKGAKTGAAFASARVNEPYTVRGKVSLMSVTEYKKYQDIIGLVHSGETWRGMMLRTPMAQLNGTRAESIVNTGKYVPKALTYTWGCAMVKAQGSTVDAAKKYKLVIAQNDTAYTNNMYVRPCFWIDKGFFAKNRLDLSKMGSAVKKVIYSNYDYYDLKNTYTEQEISVFGITKLNNTTDIIPKAENVIISGCVSAENTVMGDYKYISGDNRNVAASERNSIYKWYLFDNIYGDGVIVSNSLEFNITNDYLDKYIAFSVTPVNAYGMVGREQISKRVQVSESIIRVSKAKFVGADGQTINSANSNSRITANLKVLCTNDCIAYFGLYDDKGKLLKLSATNINEEDKDVSLVLEEISPEAGSYARIIIFKLSDMTTPVYTKTLQ